MKVIIRFGLACVVLFGVATAQQMSEEEYLAQLEEALPGTLMNNPLNPEWQVYGQDYSTKVVDAEITGAKAFQVRVKRAKANPYDIAAQGSVSEGVVAGETVLVAFWGRANTPDKTSGSGHVQFRLQLASAPYTGLVEGDVTMTEEWQIHYLSGVAQQDFQAGQLNASFNIGKYKQTLEFGQYYIMNLGEGVDPSTLPRGSVNP